MPSSKFAKAYDDITEKTVYLTVTDEEGNVSNGTGAIVYSDMGLTLMISCGHVVEDCLDLEKKAKLKVSFDLSKKKKVSFDDMVKYPATLISNSIMAEEEFSMFYVVDDTKRKRFEFCENIFPAMPVASSSFAGGRRDIAFAIGNLSKTEIVYDDDEGQTICEKKKKKRGQRVCYVVDDEGGSSGCPIVDEDGRLVAIHFSTSIESCPSSPVNPKQRYFQATGFKYGLHIDSVEEFMRDIVDGLDMKFESMGKDINELIHMIRLKYVPDPKVREFISRFNPTPIFSGRIPDGVMYAGSPLKTLITKDVETFKDAVRDKKNTFLSQLKTNDPLIGETIEILKQIYGDDGVSVTALESNAARALKGEVLASFVGGNLGEGEVDPEDLYDMVRNNKKAMKNWSRTKALVIYGINLMDNELFDKIEYVARKIMRVVNGNRRDLPWGGIQLVVIGDFWEIPPKPYAKVCFFYFEKGDGNKVWVSEGYPPWNFNIRLTLDPDCNRTRLYEIYRTWKLTLFKCRIRVVMFSDDVESSEHGSIV